METTVSIDEVSKKFQSHLDIEDNYRIIFSGPYGIGKSYFLNSFFDARKERYNKIVISPVNYVVSSNEDIFELIKVDILMQMVLTDTIQNKGSVKMSKVDKAQWFAKENPMHFLKFMTSAFKKISIGDVSMETEIFKGLFELQEKYEVYKKDLAKRLSSDFEKIGEFVNSFGESAGNIFEYNFITELINDTLVKHKDGKTKKHSDYENILIIDDLDRIDPEHIFRILNILSAHNNYLGAKNKFAFDKIILVCDIANIERIFAHKYGAQVDFKGYIDKFYSADLFQFSNKDAISLYVDALDLQLKDYDKHFLKFILNSFLNVNELTLRQIMKAHVRFDLNDNSLVQISFSPSKIKNPSAMRFRYSILQDGANPELRVSDVSFLKVMRILSFIFGSYDNLITSLDVLVNKGHSQKLHNTEIIKALSFPSLIANSIQENNVFNIFQSLEEDQNYHNTFHITWPKVKILNHDFRFRLRWQYNGGEYSSGNYFESFTIDDMTGLGNYKYNSESPPNVTGEQVYKLLLQMFRTLRTSGILEKAYI